MIPMDLERIAKRYPQLGNNLAQRMGEDRIQAPVRGMPMVAPPPMQMPVATQPRPMMGTQVSRHPSQARAMPMFAPQAQPGGMPAPQAQPGGMPAPQAQPGGMPAPQAQQQSQMPWWMQQGQEGLANLFLKYNPSSQFGFASQFGMPPPPPQTQGQPVMGQSAPMGQPQNMPQAQPTMPQPSKGSGMTRGIGSLPFGSNMPDYGPR